MKGWLIPPVCNSEFVAAMEQVLDVYKRPNDPTRPVVCMDELPRQMIREVHILVPKIKGHEKNVTMNISAWVFVTYLW